MGARPPESVAWQQWSWPPSVQIGAAGAEGCGRAWVAERIKDRMSAAVDIVAMCSFSLGSAVVGTACDQMKRASRSEDQGFRREDESS